jgi:hypothetical protein
MYLYMRIDTSELLNVQHTNSEKDTGQLHCHDHAGGSAAQPFCQLPPP